jgi:hypothetical protein
VRLVGKERCARIAHGGNPVTRWMAANVAVARDPASNGQGQESIGPIDGKLGATSSPCSRSPSRRLRRVWPSQVRGYPIVDRLIEFPPVDRAGPDRLAVRHATDGRGRPPAGSAAVAGRGEQSAALAYLSDARG